MVKKYFRLILIFLSIFNLSIAYSQENPTNKFKKTFTFGVNLGGHYSYLGGNSGYSEFYDENKINYQVGINTELKLNMYWSIYTNINYRPRGFKSVNEFPGINGIIRNEEEMNFNYLELPLMAKYRIKNSFFHLNGGIYFSKFLSVKNVLNGNDTGLDWSDSYNKLDKGVVIGTGFIFYENEDETTNMNVEIRYIHSLTGLVKYPEGDNNTLMNTFSLQLNYNFSMNKKNK